MSTSITKEDARIQSEYELMDKLLKYIEMGTQTGLWYANFFLSAENEMKLRQLESVMKGLFSRNDPDIPDIYSG
ncbi:hypothetical protein AOA59_26395, partial [Pseudomonas sp. 2822-15]|uniref:hypothetical protein n=1 Tax=Pseudomonas sp. 2822-15 TaxID=1712677 RepID=UPI000C6772F0